MCRPIVLLLGAFVALAGFLLPWPTLANTGTPEGFKDPLGICVNEDGTRAHVALHAAGKVAVVDLVQGRVLREVPVGRGPYDILWHRGMLYVSCERDDHLAVVDAEQLTVRARLPMGQAPRALALHPEGTWLYVACRDEAALHAYHLADGRLRVEPIPFRPEALSIGADGSRYVLARIQGRETLHVLSPDGKEQAGLAWASNLRRLVAASPRALAALQVPRNHVPATQVAQGWVFTNALAALPSSSPLQHARLLTLDEPQRAFADPSDVALLPDGKRCFVACAGADSVAVVSLDRKPAAGDEEGRQPGYAAAGGRHRAEDLAASRFHVVARIPTQANPRRFGLSGDGRTLVVSNTLADSLTVIDTATLRAVRHIALGAASPDAARRGAILFHTARVTFQGQFTCASCHPEGGTDGLSWDLERDGIGSFKSTKALHGIRDTAPYGWLGSSRSLSDRVRGTLRTLHRHEPQGTEVEDLSAYLEALPPARPLPLGLAEQAAAARGRALFEGKAECQRCHHRAMLDDDRSHDVGTRGPGDDQERFDTPVLRGVARTAPYLHDGRAATLEDVLTKHNPRQRHGAAHTLSPAERADLVAYLRSL